MAEMAKGADDASGEDLRELMADMAADLERACEIANEMVGAGGEEKEDAKKESESEDTKEDAKKEDAKKESEDEDAGMVVKGIERSLRRIGRSLAGFEKRQKAVEDQLGILAKQPATSGAVRFNDGSVVNGGKGEEKGGALDGAVEILKGITDPKEKDLLSRQLAAKILSGVFEGGASGKTS
jgi:hypothetical protein